MSQEQHVLLDALGEMAELWSQQNAPIAAALAPGVGSSHVQQVWDGIDVPDEAYTVWSWHNGTTFPGWPGDRVDSSIGPGSWTLMSCEQARAHYDHMRRDHGRPLDDTPEQAEFYWHEDAVPLFAAVLGQGDVFLRRSMPGVFVRTFEWDSFNEPLTPRLADAVEVWRALLAGGYYTWTGNNWVVDYAAIPLELRLHLLV